jgi:alkanesulfonate monooxygenase SsuD/methylene tetrahydromethanopterin reductase-like flavin-dependent oxidoreductase (luciferase family)
VKIGVGYAAHTAAPRVVEAAQTAEALGFDVFWITDSHLIGREALALLGALAVSTRRIEHGPGVSHLAGRHPSILASAMATLDELAPGRMRLGIGVGDSGSNNLGVPRATLDELHTAVQAIRGLLQGNEVAGPGSTPLRLSFAPTANPVPIYVASAGARTQRLAGRIADAALISASPDDLPTAIANVRAGEREAGRSPGTTRILLWTTVAIDDDPTLARAAVRGAVARRAMNALGRAAQQGTLDLEDREAFDRLQQVYDTRQHGTTPAEDLSDRAPEAWIDRFAIPGTPDKVRAGIARAAELGADEVSMILLGGRPGDRGSPAVLTRFAESVLAPLATPTRQ